MVKVELEEREGEQAESTTKREEEVGKEKT